MAGTQDCGAAAMQQMVKLTAGNAPAQKACTALLGNDGKGWSGEGMTAGPASGKQMPFSMSVLDTSKKLTCGSYACRYYWFGMGGTKIPNLINHPNYKNWKPDRVEKAGEKWASTAKFNVQRSDIRKFAFNTNNMGSMIEGWVKPTTTGEYSFYTYRSCGFPTTNSGPSCETARAVIIFVTCLRLSQRFCVSFLLDTLAPPPTLPRSRRT